MTPDVERVSAKIYQFPVKRAAERRSQTRLAEEAARYSDIVADECWYHEEAAAQEPKLPRHD